jgi:hypothetical protein
MHFKSKTKLRFSTFYKQDCSVKQFLGYGQDYWEIGLRLPLAAWASFHTGTVPTVVPVYIDSYTLCTWDCSPRRCEADHSLPSISEVNAKTMRLLPPKSFWHGVLMKSKKKKSCDQRFPLYAVTMDAVSFCCVATCNLVDTNPRFGGKLHGVTCLEKAIFMLSIFMFLDRS